MRRVGIAARAVVVALALAAPVFADAPISGVDQQYENFDSRDTFIKDRFTHLVWDRPADPYPAAMTFDAAKVSCPGTMRLPSLKELLTLVDETPHQEYDTTKGVNVARNIDEPAFRGTPPEDFWTSSSDGTRIWTVDFSDGATRTVNPGNTVARVRCVDYQP
ncbi:MAG TPA: DUF1566 domain-containing protein [Labilithrix sp.]|jgi:hypothetical protein|nr:DUF1566 domain-containing protein [Labilithrix sp.]